MASVLGKRAELERLYKTEPDPEVKERLLLVLKVVGDGMVPSQVAKQLHRSRTWASDWMARYHEEGVEGLRTRPKSGRPSKLPMEVVIKLQKKLKDSKQGWTTKQAYELIAKESGGVEYHEKYIYELLHRWGFKEKVPRKVHVNTASDEEKQDFKKRQRKY